MDKVRLFLEIMVTSLIKGFAKFALTEPTNNQASMKKLLVCVLLGAAFLLPQVLLAQGGNDTGGRKIVVRGTVTDKTGEPAIGASILEVGTTNGVITDLDGNFVIETTPGTTLVVSWIGYADYTFQARAGAPIRIALEEEALLLQETVVTAFATQKKVNVTGAITACAILSPFLTWKSASPKFARITPTSPR